MTITWHCVPRRQDAQVWEAESERRRAPPTIAASGSLGASLLPLPPMLDSRVRGLGSKPRSASTRGQSQSLTELALHLPMCFPASSCPEATGQGKDLTTWREELPDHGEK